jgi:glycosyltransferase involved in cell wall biosynthesis
MQNSKLVSVIIPTFNRLEYFKITLASALNQTYNNIEIIITDDSTTTDIQDYLKIIRDNRIKYYKNVNPLGIALNVKNGVSKSSGEYFSLLNDDDFWSKDFIEKMMAEINSCKERIGCIFCDHWLVDKNGEILVSESEKNTIIYKRNELHTGIVPLNKKLNLFTNNTVPSAMAALINKNIIDFNDYPSQIGGSYDMWLTLLCEQKMEYQFFYLNEKLTYYRSHDQMYTATNTYRVSIAIIYILTQSLVRLNFNKFQSISIKRDIKSQIRNLVKMKKFGISLKYLPLYLKCVF